MKTIYLIACTALTVVCHAQLEYKILDQNNAAAFITNRGMIFTDFDVEPGGYEIPKGSGNDAINGASFWFGGLDINDNLHLSLGGIDPGHTDVFPGPYSTLNDYSGNENWKVWTICQSEIDNFRIWWESGLPGADTTLGFVEPSVGTMAKIFSWPGNGDITRGQAYSMAPFYDRNQDGVYDPAQGDYPRIKGCCATYMVQNDIAEPHTLSGTLGMGLEMHFMIYQYESGNYINDATFIDMMAINRGTIAYSDFAYGLMIDSDLGFYADDYIGSDSLNSMLYFYNADNNDDNEYGLNPPALGIVSLAGHASSCAPYSSISPAQQAWDVLHGRQADGTSWMHPGAYPTTFAYSGNPSNAAEWSEGSSSNIPGDRRGMMSHMHGNLSSGDTVFQSYAILYARSGDHLQNVQNLMQQAADVKLFYANDTLMCSPYSAGMAEKQKLQLDVHPNPSGGLISLEFEAARVKARILQLEGTQILEKELSQQEKTLDLSNLPKGIYFLKIDSEKGSNTQKIILQ
ncbi:MAG: T9SS type A sorting domain-containing protein [Bacteroidota bacterium]